MIIRIVLNTVLVCMYCRIITCVKYADIYLRSEFYLESDPPNKSNDSQCTLSLTRTLSPINQLVVKI